jgi:RNA polymerase sigma-70 factor (ECF subfamily)
MDATIARPAADVVAAERRPDLAALYDAHGPRTYRLALRYGRGDRSFAEDLTQEVFLELIERLDDGHAIDNVGGWLYRATVHRALNRLRRERFLDLPGVRWVLGMQARAPQTPDAIASERHELRQLFAWINELPDRTRMIVCMRHLDDTPQIEIAEILGLSPGYVSKILTNVQAQLGALRLGADAKERS